MLAALLENNNNARAAAQSFKFDSRSSSGRSANYDIADGERQPRYEIVDIAAAIATFPEITGEHPMVRAARRARWINEVLPSLKEAREKRDATTFLLGAQVGAAAEREAAAEAAKTIEASEPTQAARLATMIADKRSLEQLIQIVDEVRGTTRPSTHRTVRRRGDNAMGGVVALGLFVGVVFGVTIAAQRQRRRF